MHPLDEFSKIIFKLRYLQINFKIVSYSNKFILATQSLC